MQLLPTCILYLGPSRHLSVRVLQLSIYKNLKKPSHHVQVEKYIIYNTHTDCITGITEFPV